MSRQQARRLGYGVTSLLVITIAFGLVAWRLGWARDVTVRLAGEPEERAEGSGQLAQADRPRGRTMYDVPEDFDLAAVDADADYYKTQDASRTWQQAALPAGQQRHDELLIEGEGFRLALPDSKLDKPLVVKAKPGRPVTFTALDGGLFPANGQNTITVKADDNGVAAVEFQTIDVGDYRVLAGSPENHGPAEFIIQCVTAQDKADILSGKHAERYSAEQAAAEQLREQGNAAVQSLIQARKQAESK